MTRPLVCTYLETHSLQQLSSEHGVNSRLASDRRRFSLNYHQIDAREGDPVSEQCRGLVLEAAAPFEDDFAFENRVVGTTSVCAWPMHRFYLHESGHAAKLDWSDQELRVQEKLDGTMIVLYQYAGRWCVATRAVPDADVPFRQMNALTGDQGGATFSELFAHALRRQYGGAGSVDDIADYFALDKGTTYTFELTSPQNRVVVKYARPRVTLIAVRDNRTGEELDPDCLAHLFPRPREWRIGSLSDIQAFVDQADPCALEGAVVVDSRFRRVKVKSKAWLAASRLKGNVMASPRNALEAVIRGVTPDILELLDEWTQVYLVRLEAAVRQYLHGVTMRFNDVWLASNGSRKEFALGVKRLGDWETPYFELVRGKHPNAITWAQWALAAGRLRPSGLDELARAVAPLMREAAKQDQGGAKAA